uniref:Integrase catalytic domain-containing protein n=1 Tax=Peronospora matthiolae TaxID=2874970 RepID=A0AAV1UIL2_9STRA
MIQTQFNKKVKFVRHDGAREFATSSLQDFYEVEGIEQQTTVPYAHQANGTAERAIRTIVTIGRSMLHHAKLDKCFWAEAAMTAVYVKNRLPSPKIPHKTPFEIVYNSKPSVKHMRFWVPSIHLDPEGETTQVGSQGPGWIVFGLRRSVQGVSSLRHRSGAGDDKSRCQLR